MNIKDRYSRKSWGPFTLNRHGLFHVTTFTMKLPFKKKWIIYGKDGTIQK